MAKAKQDKKIYVKKPKIGNRYWFWFAGTPTNGELYDTSDSLTEHYGEPWYMLIDKGGTKYPASIFTLRNEKPINKDNV